MNRGIISNTKNTDFLYYKTEISLISGNICNEKIQKQGGGGLFLKIHPIWQSQASLTKKQSFLISIEGVNYMKQKRFYCNNCNKWNFIFVKSNAFDTLMKRLRFLALVWHRFILFLCNSLNGASCIKQKQFT